MYLQSEVQSALHVAKDPLDEMEVRLTRGMHTEADLLNNISNIWSSQHKVLKALAKLRYSVVSKTGTIAVDENFLRVSTGVAAGLQFAIPAQ